jgi:hypothetical protein
VNRSTNQLRGFVLDFQRGTLTAATPVSITGDGTYGGGSVNFKLGAYDGGTALFTGFQSWVGFFPAALSESEVRIALSEQAVDLDDGAPTQPPKLEAYADLSGAHFYPLDENTGATATDQIGSANGTFSKTPVWIDRDGDLTTGLGDDWVSTLEGWADLKGTPKPVALGRPSRLLPVLVDPFFGIYQYSDPALGPTESIDQVYAGALELVGGGTDYTEDLTTSTITLVGAQETPITMDVKGVTVGGRWLRFPGELVDFVWQQMVGIGSADIDADSVAAYDDLHPFQAGYYFGSQFVALAAFEDYMLRPDGYAMTGIDAKRALGSRIDPSGAAVDHDLSVYDSASGSGAIARAEAVTVPPPNWLVKMGYNRTWYVHDSFLGGATAASQRSHQQSFRYVMDRRQEVRDQYADAVVRTYDTCYHKRADAALLVQRMLDLDGVGRKGWKLLMGADPWKNDIGNVILTGTYSRYDLGDKQYLVVAYDYGQTDGEPLSDPVVWG